MGFGWSKQRRGEQGKESHGVESGLGLGWRSSSGSILGNSIGCGLGSDLGFDRA